MDDIPEAIWSGSFNLFGVEVKCHTLDNGQRIIEAESMEKLFEAVGGTAEVDEGEMEKFSQWQHFGLTQ